LAFLSGIFSYLVFGLGISFGVTGLSLLLPVSALAVGLVILFKANYKKIIDYFSQAINDKKSLGIIGLILLSALVNLIGALGPELGFDALWYHLTLPKIYTIYRRIVFIPGNLLYYSAMPKLAEMFYLPAVFLNKEIIAKLTHYLFGLFSALALYRLSSRYLKRPRALLAVLVYYSSLVVGWQSITAYVDLFRAFFEILALDLFLKWLEKEKTVDLIESAVLLGLAVTTKLLATGSLVIFLAMIAWKLRHDPKKIISFSFIFAFFTFIIPLPWFIFSFVHTGNPFYPVFSGLLDKSHWFTGFDLKLFFKDFWQIFLLAQDPTLPAFLISLPVLIFHRKKIMVEKKRVGFINLIFYCLMAYVVWYFLPRTGGGRFILPYLPAFSLLTVYGYTLIEQKSAKNIYLFFLFFICLVNISYRLIANKKYLPVILGKQAKNEFLKNNLNFEFGDFLDIDGFFNKTIKNEDLVLVSGVHNLYYLNFNFVHESWAEKSLQTKYILTRYQSGETDERYYGKKIIYQNPVTNVKLYSAEE